MFEDKAYQPPPVESDEMSFAIALFVAAATGRITPANGTGLSFKQDAAFCDPVLLGAKAALQEPPARLPDEVPLACAVSVLWHHYEHDARQQAMCSRLVAFHALLARRGGGVADLRKQGREAYLLRAALSPAVVKAAATATVGQDGLFEEAEFESLVERFSGSQDGPAVLPGQRQPFPSRVQLTVTEDVQQLSLQIFAFQSCVAADPVRSTPEFRTLEQLCMRVADISGTVGLQAMLSRAWRAALPEFPWLPATPPANARLLAGLDSVQPAPTLREAMKCEMALLGLLIELLRSLLGDTVTVQLLRTLWPLADLGGDPYALAPPIDAGIHDDTRRSRRPQ
jgi:hypothetical protein